MQEYYGRNQYHDDFEDNFTDQDDEDQEDAEEERCRIEQVKQNDAVAELKREGQHILAYLKRGESYSDFDFIDPNYPLVKRVYDGVEVSPAEAESLLNDPSFDNDEREELLRLLGYKQPAIEATTPAITGEVEKKVNLPNAMMKQSIEPPAKTMTVKQCLEWASMRFIFSLIGGVFKIVDLLFYEHITDAYCLKFYKVEEMVKLYANYKVKVFHQDGGFKLLNPIQYYESKSDRRFHGIIFRPNEPTHSSFFNLYRGFAVTPAPGCCDRVKHHIKKVWCKNNDEHYQYFLDWMANCYQIGQKPGVAVEIIGEKGSGKSLIASYLGIPFGRHFMAISDPSQLIGKFNDYLVDKVFITLEEAAVMGDQKAESKLKCLISERTMITEAKFGDVNNSENHIRILMTSNEAKVIAATKDERRHFTLRATNDYIGDLEYFNLLIEEMNNGGPEALCYELLNRTYSMDSLRKAPRTEEISNQIFENDDVFRFLVTCINRKSLINVKENTQPVWDKVIKQAFYEEFLKFKQTYDGQVRAQSMSTIEFGRRLKGWIPLKKDTKIQKKSAYQFPSLEDCKKAIEASLKTQWDWE